MKLIDFYRTQIPIWEVSRTQELFELAKKDYPGIKSIDDAICQADGAHLRQISFLLLSITKLFPKHLSDKTKKKFHLSVQQLPDWIKPPVLEFDAKILIRLGMSVDRIKDRHCTFVETITTFKIWTRAINYRLRREQYGHRIIDAPVISRRMI